MNIQRIIFALWLATLVAIGERVTQAADGVTNSDIIPLIQLERVPVTTAIDNLARQAEINYLLDPKCGFSQPPGLDQRQEPNVSLTWTNLSARDALIGLLNCYGMHLMEITNTTVSKITLTNSTAGRVDTTWVRQDTNSAIPLVQMNMVPLDDALSNFARVAHLELELSDLTPPALGSRQNRVSTPTLSFRWTSITPRQGIAAICDTFDLSMTHDAAKNLIRISRRGSASSK